MAELGDVELLLPPPCASRKPYALVMVFRSDTVKAAKADDGGELGGLAMCRHLLGACCL